MKVGIDCMAFDVPKIHLPIKALAEKRNIASEKLEKGLGLKKMTIPDMHQDVICFAANALVKLIEANEIDLNEISRIYVGSESGLDASKPIASYLTSMMEEKFGNEKLKYCDAVDFTFACIGAIDALHNTLDYIRLNPHKKAIVIATDIAKYDLESGGEYTQGAGAVAMLISAHPRLVSFNSTFGISTQGVFDFFKPKRNISKAEITGNNDNAPWMDILETEINIHKEQPIFDGHYSNECYKSRTKEAYLNFKNENHIKEILFKNWKGIIMHLPYAYQGRRTFSDIYAHENKLKDDLKIISKSEAYIKLVEECIAPSERASSEVGNIYTGSIFLALMSSLSVAINNNEDLTGEKFGLIAYGSGSKSKVFEVQVEATWHEVVHKISLFETLKESKEIDFETYEKLHKKELKKPVLQPKKEWILDKIESNKSTLLGARYYKWIK